MITTSSKERLAKSTLITVAFHVAAAAILLSKPLHLNPRFFSQIGRAPSLFVEEENMVLFKKNIALEEAFNHFEVASRSDLIVHTDIPNPIDSTLAYELIPPSMPTELVIPDFKEGEVLAFSSPELTSEGLVLVEPPLQYSFHPHIPTPAPQYTDELNYQVPLPASPFIEQESLAIDFLPSKEKTELMSIIPSEMPALMATESAMPLLQPAPFTKLEEERLPFIASDFSISPSMPRSITGIRFDGVLTDYGLPYLQLHEWNECFDLDVKTFAKEEGGYLFTIQIIPKVNLSEYRLKQNYLFAIDRSNVKDKSRIQSAKRATQRAISSLRPGDYFNIVFLDANMTRFSPEPVPFNKGNCQLMEEFLEKQSNKSVKAHVDVYTALTHLLDSKISNDEAITAILISDGGPAAKSNLHRTKINEWLEKNRDRVTLHTATCGSGINLSSLKMLSLASRGSLLYSDTHAAFPRKLAKLVMDLRYPIAKEMTVSIVADNPSSIELMPPSSRLPNLFSDHPYVLMGSCEQLSDFTLVLEGKNKDEVFTIKKNISLSQAKPGSRLLLKQWSAEKAHLLLDKYLQEGEKTVLQEAEKQLGHDTQNSRR